MVELKNKNNPWKLIAKKTQTLNSVQETKLEWKRAPLKNIVQRIPILHIVKKINLK